MKNLLIALLSISIHVQAFDCLSINALATSSLKEDSRHYGVSLSVYCENLLDPKTAVVDILGVEADKVVDSASFVDDLGADSLDTVELVMAFEEEFNIEIPDEIAEKITTIKDAIEHIEKSQN